MVQFDMELANSLQNKCILEDNFIRSSCQSEGGWTKFACPHGALLRGHNLLADSQVLQARKDALLADRDFGSLNLSTDLKLECIK